LPPRPGGLNFSFFGDKVSASREALAQACSTALGSTLSGSAKSTQSVVDQVEKPLQRISRTQFDVDAPDAGFQTGCNLKESQTDLADRGLGQRGAP